MINKTTQRMAARHLEKVALKGHEGCGLVVRSGASGRGQRFIPAENLIGTESSSKVIQNTHLPSQGFLIDPELYLKHSRDIIAIVHSHLYDGEEDDGDLPSPTDVMRQRATAVPWVVFVLQDGKYSRHYQFGEAPGEKDA